MSDRKSALLATGCPPAVVEVLNQFDVQDQQLSEQGYRADVHRQHYGELLKVTSQALVAKLNAAIAEVEKERDSELRELESTLAELTRIPTKAMTQSDSEYQSALLKRQIRELDRVASVNLALADAQTISATSDPGTCRSFARRSTGD